MKLLRAIFTPARFIFRRTAYIVSVAFTGDIPPLARAQQDSVIVRQKNLYIEQLKDMLEDTRKHMKGLSEQVDITNGWNLAGKGVSIVEEIVRNKFMPNKKPVDKAVIFEDLKTLITNINIKTLYKKYTDDKERNGLLERAKKEGITDEQIKEIIQLIESRLDKELEGVA